VQFLYGSYFIAHNAPQRSN